MESKVLNLRLDEEKNQKLDEILDKLKENEINISKTKFYHFSGVLGYFNDKREKLTSKTVDATRVEFLFRSEYIFQNMVLESIFESQKDNLSEEIDKYRLFEEYANAGVEFLYDLFKKSNDLEEFLENLELEIYKAMEKLGINNKEVNSNEEI
ncbi:hypothetical protein H17ap60334_07898 [Thermosipho africanus H17ap60334]|jgi:hypothetical protein|uniref:hypothetical protein n=1 Tax=Thermosipho africanus TaxID=2421 RepID=UPI00028D3C94|nr:hypothetical protein [Thermosipho africanus]EKF49056.1 hypothetical protein H17ap60334_07898 [Thermosipho africanus H17ap60334]MDN5324754.1 hypothetical protein [Thermosipho sp. (in: thermotogales)]